MADKWKQIAMGTVISIAGVLGLTSCENKNENQEENKKPQTELRDKSTVKLVSWEDIKKDANVSDGAWPKKVTVRKGGTHEDNFHIGENHMTVTIPGKTYEFPAPNNPDGEEISQKQPKQEKKEPSKGPRNDALINALLAEKRGGRGGKKS